MLYDKIVDKYDINKYIQEKASYVIAKGGDGTLLRAIKLLAKQGKPFFGIGSGTMNFLMNSEEEMSHDYTKDSFNLIRADVVLKSGLVETIQVFNEICIGGDMASWIDFTVRDKDRIIGSFKGGGLIFSTAQGSTGINKNNNGTILPLSSSNWCVTGDKCNRNVNYVIEPNPTTIEIDSRTPVTVWGDGTNYILEDAKRIELSKGISVELIFNDYNEFKRKRRS